MGVQTEAEDQLARLRYLSRSGVLHTPEFAAFEELRTVGMGEAGLGSSPVAERLVECCFELAVWFFRLRTGDSEPIEFVRADPAKLRVLSERLALLKPLIPRLRRDFERRTVSEPLMESESARFEAGIRDAPAGRSEQSRVATAVERLLINSGWDIPEPNHDAKEHRSLGSVVVNPRAVDGRRADYLLLVGGQAVGLVARVEVSEDHVAAMERVEAMAGAFSDASPWPVWRSPLPYRYVSDGRRLHFRDANDPDPSARRVSGFHRPATMARWLREVEADSDAPTYGARLALRLPPLERDAGRAAGGALREPQHAAIAAIEEALGAGRRRALVQMVVGSGKTLTEIVTAYRQLEYAKANRILFVTDRKLEATQLIDLFRQFSLPGEVRSFTELYNVVKLTAATRASSASVVVATVQQLRSILSSTNAVPAEIDYCSALPPDEFDLIVVDDCHRSVAGPASRALLDYFDARILGFTSTPAHSTYDYFDGEPVSVYTLEQALADDRAVDYALYQARLEPSRRAVLVPHDNDIEVAGGLTAGSGASRRVVEPAMLVAVLQAFKESLTSLFPGHEGHPRAVPKTLIVAYDGAHAKQIASVVREVFVADRKFSRRIDGHTGDPGRRLREFRTDPEFRIAVVARSFATGIDVPTLECLLLLSDVRSEIEYTQLLARGTRQVSTVELRAVSPGAIAKTQLVVIDAVGASRHHPRRLVNVTDAFGAAGAAVLSRLLGLAESGGLRPQEIAELGLRLARLVPLQTEAEAADIRFSVGASLEDLVRPLLEASATGHSVRRDDHVLSQVASLRETLLDIQGRSAGSASGPSRRHASTAGSTTAFADRLARVLKDRLGVPTANQVWWIEHIADAAASSSRFDPTDLNGVPFSGRGGTDGFLREFGAEGALDLLDELGRELA
jgi:type I restriction enzyme R subunit